MRGMEVATFVKNLLAKKKGEVNTHMDFLNERKGSGNLTNKRGDEGGQRRSIGGGRKRRNKSLDVTQAHRGRA